MTQRDDLYAGYEQGQRDMLAKCVAAVESLPGLFTRRQEVMEVLRALHKGNRGQQ